MEYFEYDIAADLIALWKTGRHTELGHFDLAEAESLLESLTKAIDEMKKANAAYAERNFKRGIEGDEG